MKKCVQKAFFIFSIIYGNVGLNPVKIYLFVQFYQLNFTRHFRNLKACQIFLINSCLKVAVVLSCIDEFRFCYDFLPIPALSTTYSFPSFSTPSFFFFYLKDHSPDKKKARVLAVLQHNGLLVNCHQQRTNCTCS
jgi:hypothetical protein